MSKLYSDCSIGKILFKVWCLISIFTFCSDCTLRSPPSALIEELSTARRSQVDLLSSHPSMMKSSSDIPLNRTPTPSQTELHYNYHRVMPPMLYKSVSSNILPPHYHSRGGVHPARPWRLLSSSTTRPVGLPYSISQQSLNSRTGSQCQCDSIRIQVSRFISLFRKSIIVDCVWNVMAHAQETRFRLSAKRTSPFKSAGGGVSSVDYLQPRCAHQR